MWRLWFIIVGVVLLTSTAVSSYATTINAATCYAADVQSAINSAVTGDIVLVPSGSCNWGSATVVIDGKNITVQGAGIDVTTITATGTIAWRIGSQGGTGNSSRITAFTTITAAGQAAVVVDGDGWRIDHMKLRSSTSGALCNGVWAYGLRSGVPAGPTGLIDHITFIDCRPLIFGFPDVAAKQGSLWVSPLGLGDANAVYIEDSTWFFNGGEANLIDCNYGGRWVMRFNTTTGSSIDSHSNQGERGCRRWEVYNNTVNFSQPYFTPVFIRGGTGTIFGTTISSGWTEPFISFDNVRSFEPRAPLMQCNGTSAADGNQHLSSDAGWPCRDQIGWNTDMFKWTTGTPNPPQLNEPAYLWSNTIGGSLAKVNIRNGVTAWIQANRDYYNQGASFNGTTGVGVGILDSRPSTCTTGVAYWATDQGEWNSKQPGADGQLYKCKATNTWTLYYIPYTYPHPLQTGAGINTYAAPAPPTNMIVR